MERQQAMDRALALPWVRQGDWAGSLLLRGHVFAGLQREVPAWTGCREGTEAFLQAGPATWLVRGAFEGFAAAYLARCRAEPQRIADLAERFEGVLAEIRLLEADLQTSPPGDRAGSARLAGTYARLEMASQPYSYVFGYGEDVLVGRLVQDVAERGGVAPGASLDVARRLLIPPLDVATQTQAAQEALLDLADLAERTGLRPGGPRFQKAAVAEALRAHLARFGDFAGGPAAVLASARALVGRAGEERERRRREAAEREAAWREQVEALRPSPADRRLLVALRRQVGVRTARREAWMRAQRAYEPHLRAIEDALGLEERDAHLLTHEELVAALDGEPLPDLRAREGGAALLAVGGQLHVFAGSDAARLVAHAEGEGGGRDRTAGAEGETLVLVGTGASPGRVRGAVRVVRGASDGDKVGKGDILVADMTQPDLVLACGRAAAIVTDLGGMLCHAAIVARELGIPCVLATGRATRVLRDGDLVEVDGEAGRVTVVRRAAGPRL